MVHKGGSYVGLVGIRGVGRGRGCLGSMFVWCIGSVIRFFRYGDGGLSVLDCLSLDISVYQWRVLSVRTGTVGGFIMYEWL